MIIVDKLNHKFLDSTSDVTQQNLNKLQKMLRICYGEDTMVQHIDMFPTQTSDVWRQCKSIRYFFSFVRTLLDIQTPFVLVISKYMYGFRLEAKYIVLSE